MKILNHRQILQKIKRLSIEILEHNYSEPEIILAGINQNGLAFARLLQAELQILTEIPIKLSSIHLNPADPLSEEVKIALTAEQINGKAIIIVDDVANTGRTIFYAFKPMMFALPRKIQVAVLIDRTHKAFPVQVDFYGMSLATTLKEHISVNLKDVSEFEVLLN